MLEEWNDGILEWWNSGIMEHCKWSLSSNLKIRKRENEKWI